MRLVTQKPVVKTTAYGAGQAVGGLLTFPFRSTAISTILISRAELLEDTATPQATNLQLHLFGDPSLAIADGTAWTLPKASYEAGNYFGKLDFPSANWVASPVRGNAGAKSCLIAPALLIPGGKKVFGQLIAVATPTFAAVDVLDVMLWLGEYA